MNKNIVKNIKLSNNEKIFSDFRKLSGKNNTSRIVLTNKRLIIYKDNTFHKKKRKIREKGMDEIDIFTITHIKHLVRYIGGTYVSKLIGFILALAGLVLGTLVYFGGINVPTILSVAYYNRLAYYITSGFFFLVGFIIFIYRKKTLHLVVISGYEHETEVILKARKYNERAIRYITSKLPIQSQRKAL
ncbi:MAG: hypothetical protein ACOCUD_04685 [Bacillota bacterium]